MATSGSVDFVATRVNLILHALQMVGGLGLGETASSDQTTQASFMLNGIIKNWHSMGMPTWAMKFGYVLPVTDSSTYTMTTGHVVTTYVHTLTSAAAASGASTIDVDSITGISSSNVIGVEQSDGTMQWTTVNGAPSGSTVTLTASLTGAVSADANVYVYATTNRVTNPLKVHGAWRRNQENTTDVPLLPDERNNYMDLAGKNTAGTPVRYYYDPGNTTGTLYIWPRFSNGDELIVISYQRPFEDMDADANDLDFPQAWILPMTWELAYNLAPFYGIPPDERRVMRQEAEYFFNKVAGWDQEEGSIYLQPSERVG